MNNEQRLVDICFEIAFAVKAQPNLPREELAIWVAEQLAANGFKTVPRGMSWGVISDGRSIE